MGYVQPQAQYARAAVVPATSITMPQATTVFNTIDTNGDGKISRAEFSNYVMGTTANYVKPAASVSTYSNAVAAPSFQYVQPQAQYTRAPASITVQPQAASVFNAIDTN